MDPRVKQQMEHPTEDVFDPEAAIHDLFDDYAQKTKMIRSDGGSSSYYALPPHADELRHLISAKAMSFARGNLFKACYRLGEKEGTDILYDLNKMKFFVEDLIEMYNRGEPV